MKRWFCVWPTYIDAGKTVAEGRKIPKGLCVKQPNFQELLQACQKLGLKALPGLCFSSEIRRYVYFLAACLILYHCREERLSSRLYGRYQSSRSTEKRRATTGGRYHSHQLSVARPDLLLLREETSFLLSKICVPAFV
jgi:hypothetical protein